MRKLLIPAIVFLLVLAAVLSVRQHAGAQIISNGSGGGGGGGSGSGVFIVGTTGISASTAVGTVTLSLATPIAVANGGTGQSSMVFGVPPSLEWFGTGAEADPAIASGTTTIQGEHDYASLTISGSGQLAVSTTLGNRWALVRVAGTCSLATTATCVKEDGTNDTACAVKAVGNGIAGGGSSSFLGSGGGGGGAAGSTNGGVAGGTVNSTLGVYQLAGAAGGVVAGANPAAGATPSPGQAASYLQILSQPLDMLLWATGGSTNLSWGGSNSGAGGAGTGTGGTKNAGGITFVLICKSFSTMTGHIVAAGGPGGAGTACGNAGGGGGGGGGNVVVAGPGGYTAANIDVNGGNGGAACAGGQNGAAGGKGTGFNCDTTAGTCTQL